MSEPSRVAIDMELAARMVDAKSTSSCECRNQAEALVPARHRDEQRARPRERRFFEERSGRDRAFAQAIGGPKRPPQDQPFPFGHVDADVLHQPRRQAPHQERSPSAGASERRASARLSPACAVSSFEGYVGRFASLNFFTMAGSPDRRSCSFDEGMPSQNATCPCESGRKFKAYCLLPVSLSRWRASLCRSTSSAERLVLSSAVIPHWPLFASRTFTYPSFATAHPQHTLRR